MSFVARDGTVILEDVVASEEDSESDGSESDGSEEEEEEGEGEEGEGGEGEEIEVAEDEDDDEHTWENLGEVDQQAATVLGWDSGCPPPRPARRATSA